MAFDYFTQPQGPTIPISLFGDAATAGIHAGNALPTGITAAIQGGIKGVGEGLDIQAKYQENQVRQNQIEREPVQNQIQDEELKRIQTQNEIQSLNLDTEQKTHDIALENTKTKLTLENQAATQKLEDLNATKELGQALGSNDPNERARALHDPRFTRILLTDSQLAENTLSRLAGDKEQPQSVRDEALKLWDFSKQKHYELEKERIDTLAKKEALGNMPEAQKALMKDPQIGRIMSEYKLEPTQLGKVQIFDFGLKTFSKDGTLDTSKPDNDISMGSAFPGKYQVVVDGKLAKNIPPMDKSSATVLQGWQSNLYNAGYRQPASATPSPSATPNPDKPYSSGFFSGVGQPITSALTPNGPTNTPGVVGTPNPNATPNPRPTPPTPTINVEGNNPVVNNAAQELLNKAKKDPDLMTRLQAKGYVNVPKETPTQVTPRSGMPVPKNVSEVVNVLPPEAKKYVEPKILDRISTDSTLQNLTPLQQAVIAVESGGNPDAKGKGTSAQGLFQMTDAAAKDTKENVSTVAGNIRGGVKFLNQLLDRFNGSEVAALMAYNIGPSAVADAIAQVNSTDYQDIIFGLKYLQSKGRYKTVLTDANIKTAETYPLKVLAYKDAFSQITYV